MDSQTPTGDQIGVFGPGTEDQRGSLRERQVAMKPRVGVYGGTVWILAAVLFGNWLPAAEPAWITTTGAG